MDRKLIFYSDGTIYETDSKGDGQQAIRAIATGGDLNQLRRLLDFTAATQFAIAPADQPHPEVMDVATRGGKRVNDEGITLIKTYEGLAEQVLDAGKLVAIKAYQDVVNVWTIGYGHTKTATPNQQITPEEADNLLFQDLEEFENAVSDAVQVDVNDNQFAALVAFAFNLGAGALFQSTLLKKLNAGDYQGAADELPRWNKAGGQRLLGLTRRRLSERALFLGQPWRPSLTYDGPVDPERIKQQLASSTPTAAAPASTTTARTLKLTTPMMQGDDVQQLQAVLKSKGFVFNANGAFDEITQEVVKRFQQQQKMEADGVVGPSTREALGMA